jgi:hypothetical protein
VLVQEVLRRRDDLNLLAVTKIVLGYPPLLLLLAVTMPYLHWRTRGVPVEEDDDPQPDAAPGLPTGAAG